MINKQDFDKINKGIAKRNAGKRKFKAILISGSILFSITFLCIGSVAQNVFIQFLIPAVLVLISLIFALRIKQEPYFTLEQYAQKRAIQKNYIKQVETQHAMQHGFVGAQTQDTRYIPDQLRLAVLGRDNHRCQNCGSNSYLELDHIIPLSRGGATSYENLQVLCRGCNQRKGVF